MRRKSERNKTASLSSPEKVKTPSRRGKRLSKAPEVVEFEKTVTEEDEVEEQSANESTVADSDQEVDEPVSKSRRKLTRGAAKNTEERPTRSRRRTTAHSTVVVIDPVVEEVPEEQHNAENGDNVIDINIQPIVEEPKEESHKEETITITDVTDEKVVPDNQETVEIQESVEIVPVEDEKPEALNEYSVIEPTTVVDDDATVIVIEPIEEDKIEQTTETPIQASSPARKSPEPIEIEKPQENNHKSSAAGRHSHRSRRARNRSTSSSSDDSSSDSDTETKHKTIASPNKSESGSKRSRTKSPVVIPLSREDSPVAEVEEKTVAETVEQMDVTPEIEENTIQTDELKTIEISSEPATNVEEPTGTQTTTTDEPKKSRDEKENKDKRPASIEKKSKPIRKRRWLSQKSTESKPQILAISTDSLKNLISDVKPVPLSDVKLESSPEPEEVPIVTEKEEKPRRTSRERDRNRRRDRSIDTRENERNKLSTDNKVVVDEKSAASSSSSSLNANRKISIVNDAGASSSSSNTKAESVAKVQRPPSPAKFNSTNILFITNLVRPFTVLQLKGLLARTGKIVENGFWIDKIKSKCYVKYETEDEAVETRHALHGVRWPTSNPKCLNVDFGSEGGMEKAVASTCEDGQPKGNAAAGGGRDERVSGAWDRFEMEEKRDAPVNRPIREWDLGKKEDLGREPEREREKNRDRVTATGEREGRADRAGREGERIERRKRSADRDRVRRSTSASPSRKIYKEKNDPPLRLLDDLFRKTKTTPCIYWLPLTAEQIAVREEARRQHMAEHRRRIEENIQKEKERAREREKERERNNRGDKDRSRNRERSSERRRRDTSRSSKTRDTGDKDRDRRRY